MKNYVDVVYTTNLHYGRSYTYEAPDRFVSDLEHGANLVVVERRGELALALVVDFYTHNEFEGKETKPILDVCKRVKINAQVSNRVAKSVGVSKDRNLF